MLPLLLCTWVYCFTFETSCGLIVGGGVVYMAPILTPCRFPTRVDLYRKTMPPLRMQNFVFKSLAAALLLCMTLCCRRNMKAILQHSRAVVLMLSEFVYSDAQQYSAARTRVQRDVVQFWMPFAG